MQDSSLNASGLPSGSKGTADIDLYFHTYIDPNEAEEAAETMAELITDWSSRLVNDENPERYQSLIDYLAAVGEEKGATPGELSLAWILHKKPYIVPIPGMRSSKRLAENAKAADIVLSAEELAKIDELSGLSAGGLS